MERLGRFARIIDLSRNVSPEIIQGLPLFSEDDRDETVKNPAKKLELKLSTTTVKQSALLCAA